MAILQTLSPGILVNDVVTLYWHTFEFRSQCLGSFLSATTLGLSKIVYQALIGQCSLCFCVILPSFICCHFPLPNTYKFPRDHGDALQLKPLGTLLGGVIYTNLIISRRAGRIEADKMTLRNQSSYWQVIWVWEGEGGFLLLSSWKGQNSKSIIIGRSPSLTVRG